MDPETAQSEDALFLSRRYLTEGSAAFEEAKRHRPAHTRNRIAGFYDYREAENWTIEDFRDRQREAVIRLLASFALRNVLGKRIVRSEEHARHEAVTYLQTPNGRRQLREKFESISREHGLIIGTAAEEVRMDVIFLLETGKVAL